MNLRNNVGHFKFYIVCLFFVSIATRAGMLVYGPSKIRCEKKTENSRAGVKIQAYPATIGFPTSGF